MIYYTMVYQNDTNKNIKTVSRCPKSIRSLDNSLEIKTNTSMLSSILREI